MNRWEVKVIRYPDDKTRPDFNAFVSKSLLELGPGWEPFATTEFSLLVRRELQEESSDATLPCRLSLTTSSFYPFFFRSEEEGSREGSFVSLVCSCGWARDIVVTSLNLGAIRDLVKREQEEHQKGSHDSAHYFVLREETMDFLAGKCICGARWRFDYADNGGRGRSREKLRRLFEKHKGDAK